MGRPPRASEGGLIYHVLNRANARLAIFDESDDYDAFLRVLGQAVQRFSVQLLAYCLMPNHFPLVVRPEVDGELSRFMRWVTLTHTQRWHAQRQSAGSGHLYQGRFKSFLIQDDDHFIVACRYVERNALRAGLVARAEEWKWGSLGQHGSRPINPEAPPLHLWPIPKPRNWIKRVNSSMSPAEEEAIARSIRRSQPFGGPEWQAEVIGRLGLESTTRPIGRPRKSTNGS
jgi:putative transposase